MANGEGNGKWKSVLLKVVGGIVSAAIIANATFTYNTSVRLAVIETKMEARKVQIDTIGRGVESVEAKIDEIHDLIDLNVTGDSTQTHDIRTANHDIDEVKEDLKDHIRRTMP